MRRVFGTAVVGALALALSGCTEPGPDPAPTATTIPTEPTSGAKHVCGMDVASVETATGTTVGRVEDRLVVLDGVVSGKCSVWPEDESLLDGTLLVVNLYPASAPEGLEAQARVDGEGYRAPDAVYDGLDGAVWGQRYPDQMTHGGLSIVFWGDTVIDILTTRGETDRDHVTDLAALTRQIAATYELGL